MKTTLVAAFLFFVLVHAAMGQEAELKVQSGHGMVLCANRLAISNDGRFLASAGGNTKLWDMATGREIRTFNGTNALDISRDGKLLAAAVDDSIFGIQKSFRIWELETGKEVRIFGAHGNAITDVKFSPDGSTIASTSSDKTIKVWDVRSGKIIRTINGHKVWVTCVNMSRDGKYLISGGGDKVVKCWDLQTGKLIRTYKKQAQTIRSVAFSEDGKSILASSSGDGDNPTIVIFDTETGAVKFTFSAASPACFSTDSKYVFAQDHADKSIIQISIAENKIIQRYSGHTDYLFAMTVSQDGKYVVSASQDKTIRVWDIATVRELKILQGVTKAINSLNFSANDLNIISLNGYNDLQIWETATLSYLKSYGTFMPVHVSKNKNLVLQLVKGKMNAVNLLDIAQDKILTTFSDEESTFEELAMAPDASFFISAHNNGKLKIWDIASGKIRSEIQTTSTYIRQLELSADGKFCIHTDITNAIFAWDIESKQVVKTFKGHAYGVMAIDISSDGNYLVSGSSDGVLCLWDFPGNKKLYSKTVSTTDGITDLNISPDNSSILYSTFGIDIGIMDLKTGTITGMLKGHKASVFRASYSHDGVMIISGSDDGEIKIWNTETRKELAAIVYIAGSEGDYVAYTPDGYYMATKGGTKAVHFTRDNNVYYFDQFDLQYNRPDIVLERLGKAPKELIDSYRRAYEKRLKRLNFSPEKFGKEKEYNAPSIEILNTQAYYASVPSQDFHFDVFAEDKQYKLDRLNIWVNGVPVYGKEGMNLRSLAAKNSTLSCNVALSSGKNTIEVSVLNEKGIESIKKTIEVNYNAASGKPDLYLIALGVSKYRDSNMNLNYAAKDARDFIRTFSTATDQYNRIVVDSILDHAATLSNIKALRKKLLNTKVDDRVILFIAGHGLLDQNLDYYLATHDVDFINPAAKGLPYETLEELLNGIPARNKMILMDACHSGEVDKEEMKLVAQTSTEQGEITFRSFGNMQVKRVGLENSFELMKQLFSDLRKGNGTTVISSAGGAEYAMEGAQWQNGIFTYCLLSGLTDKKADLNKDGKIMLSELQKYLLKTVPEITNGKQKPTSRTENLSNDWQVW